MADPRPPFPLPLPLIANGSGRCCWADFLRSRRNLVLSLLPTIITLRLTAARRRRCCPSLTTIYIFTARRRPSVVILRVPFVRRAIVILRMPSVRRAIVILRIPSARPSVVILHIPALHRPLSTGVVLSVRSPLQIHMEGFRFASGPYLGSIGSDFRPPLPAKRSPIPRKCQSIVEKGEEAEETMTAKGIEVAEERDKLLQKERERKERERISEKRRMKKKRRMIARLRRAEEKEKEHDSNDAIRQTKDRDEARMAEEARKAQLADARRKAQEAQLAEARRKAELSAARRKTEAKMAHGSTSAQRMPALPKAKNQGKYATWRAADALQYRTCTDGITFKDVVLGAVTGKQHVDEMTQLAVAEEMAEPMSQSQEVLKRSEVSARRMAIAEGKRPLLSQIPSEKQEKWINEENQQGTQEQKKKPREVVARAEEEHHGELYPDVLLMLGAMNGICGTLMMRGTLLGRFSALPIPFQLSKDSCYMIAMMRAPNLHLHQKRVLVPTHNEQDMWLH